MSFQTLLKQHLDKMGHTTYEMEKTYGIDRATLNRCLMKNVLPSQSFAEHMIGYLHLTPTEEQVLWTAWHIEKEGESLYLQRIGVERCLETLCQILRPSLTERSAALPKHTGVPLQNTVYISGEEQISRYLYPILRQAMDSHSSEPILFSVPGQCNYFYRIMVDICKSNPHPQMELHHLVRLNAVGDSPDNISMAALEQLPHILELVYSCDHQYHPYYFYNRTNLKDCIDLLYPHYCITAKQCILLSADCKSMLLLEDETAVQAYRDQFEQRRSLIRPLLLRMNSLLETAQFVVGTTGKIGGRKVLLSHSPCMLKCFTQDLVERCIAPHTPHRKELIQFVLGTGFLDTLYGKEDILLFTQAGVERFWQTGRLPEYPSQLVLPIPTAERHGVLERFIKVVEKDCPYYRMVNTQKIPVPQDITLEVINDDTLLFSRMGMEWDAEYLRLPIQGVGAPFKHVLGQLRGSSAIMTKTQTLDALHSVMESPLPEPEAAAAYQT